MNWKQKSLIFVSATLHFVAAAYCPTLDNPLPSDGLYHNNYPIMTVFVMAPLIATGLTLLIAGFKNFWIGKRKGQLHLVLLLILCVSYMIVLGAFGGEPFMWIYFLPILGIFYICCLTTTLFVRWLYGKLVDS